MFTEAQLLERIDQVMKGWVEGIGSAKLLPQQADRFIRAAIDNSKLMREVRTLEMTSDTKNIDKIVFGNRVLQKPVAEGTEHTDTTGYQTEQRQLVAKEFIIAVNLFYSTLEDNIEKENFESTLLDLIGGRASADFEEVGMYANPAASGADAVLSVPTHTGWLTGLAGHITDYNCAAPSAVSDVFKALINSVPSKHFGSKPLNEWRLYCSFQYERAYRDELAGRATAAGDRALLEDVPVFYQGVPVIWLPKIKTETRETVDNISDVMFVHPANLVQGWKRDITLERERKPRKRQIEFTITARWDFNEEESDAIAQAKDVGLPA
ncbi:MAG: hypothetical protein PHV74_00195 [Dehalococcoidia bacterium]|nr:hypothetical protein [Dehalococcoidia bacterium]